MIIFPRFGKFFAGNTNFNAPIIKLLQKVQILPNELCNEKYSPDTLLLQSFFTANFAIKTITIDIEVFLSD